ncbi:MAG TPA: cobalamin-independent methionine synthase II family protein [Streptosporangiaceae bacterium]|jgi:5-methyltetrahydropteroyltriglutamate--homocysteine methyltransferase|nr:cobalamin-independent methionine synthase II family protein [Streptosporangiaceae bacterium]
MRRSRDRILTTHTGSLPRPADLDQLIADREAGEKVDEAAFEKRVELAVADVVASQLAVGVSVISDGEAGKPGYSTYVKDRLTGFEGTGRPLTSVEGIEFPELTPTTVSGAPLLRSMNVPACNGPIALRDTEAVHRDIDNLKASVQDAEPADVFMTAASPGVIATFLANDYYDTDEEYLYALADAMKPEYDAIAAAGLVLQVDCPDLAMTRAMLGNDMLTDEEFRDQIRLHVRALNHALRDIPPEQMRMHLCWGNSERPHITDIPMASIVDVVLEARPAGLSFEAANPRHAHEWKVWRDVRLPDGKVLIPGVIDSTTNFVEHPELVAQRIITFAEVAGKENIIAGTDCGFGTFAGYYAVKPRITWLKLASMAEGAELASRYLWKRGR